MRSITAAALCVALLCGSAACTGTKIGVVNPARLFQDSEPGKAGIAHLKRIETDIQARLATAQELLQKSPDDEALRARFQQVFAGYQQLIAAEQQKVVQSVNARVQTALENYRSEKGLTAILNRDGVLAHAPAADVTEAVLGKMNGEPLTFEPVVLEDFTAAPAVEKPKK